MFWYISRWINSPRTEKKYIQYITSFTLHVWTSFLCSSEEQRCFYWVLHFLLCFLLKAFLFDTARWPSTGSHFPSLMRSLLWKTFQGFNASGIFFLLSSSYMRLSPTSFQFSDLYSLLGLAAFMFPPCCSRTQFGLPESEACFLQGSGQRRLRGLAVEKEGREGLLFTEMEEVLVCSEGQLPVLVHQWGGKSQPPHSSEKVFQESVSNYIM